MPGLILEGGTMRPIFSCGVMDALLAHGLMFDYVVGVSAGITNAFSYLSRQSGRNLEVLRRYRNDPRYINPANYLKDGSLFGLDFIYEQIPKTLLPYDWAAFREYRGRVYVGVTNARTGLPEYLDGRALDDKNTMLRATCAIPLYFPAIFIGGTPYYDGGLSDPIPIRKALADGSKKNLILLTQPEGYRKGKSRSSAIAAAALRHKYPNLVRVLNHRPKLYNDTVCFVEQLTRRHPERAVLLRPQAPINSFESDVSKIEATYRAGYQMAEERMEEIRSLF